MSNTAKRPDFITEYGWAALNDSQRANIATVTSDEWTLTCRTLDTFARDLYFEQRAAGADHDTAYAQAQTV